MSKRSIILIIVALLLAGFWVYAYSGLFDSNRFEIVAKLKPPDHPSRDTVYPVIFGFNSDFVIESIEVVPAEPGPGEDAKPLWHLVYSDKAQQKAKRRADKRPGRFEYPIKTQTFMYGQRVRGLEPAEKGDHAQALEPGAKYRLIVRARHGWGRTEFVTRKVPQG